MNSFADLLSNRWLWVAVLSSTAAQLLKVFLILLIERRWRPGAFMETGGMPSSHSAMVAALTTGVGITEGVGSPLFAASAVFALIVMYDATGVRHSSGQQARLLNDLVEELRAVVREGFAPLPLRVLLGHTYLEVLVGTLLGVAAGFIAFSR
ncbi:MULTISPECIES: divergent PAP2 family protein [Deinococcus]|uniref:Acid phosphatase n=3 Tax=Deinococcus TaxID=1298 RepID=A0A0F7JMN3_9DEIO|nr:MULTISPECIES: divergent PAP2 family protein [Deinococcus]MXV21859.1 divergent PAP2 family protein [Deinococcus xianganensis]AKH15920.1 acid phosphatase [Deinococcus soli (ex Cha et al. 2016)]MDK2013773.1 divergent PAP2 family protein [Deinococcus sp. 43]RIY15277.1 divergent PAP2 family protein [Deinococcus sp. RM]BBN94765.1 membrane protein [Deinococcus grandis]